MHLTHTEISGKIVNKKNTGNTSAGVQKCFSKEQNQ